MKTGLKVLGALLVAGQLLGFATAHGQTVTNPPSIRPLEPSPLPLISSDLSITPVLTDEERQGRLILAPPPSDTQVPLTTVRPVRPEQNEITEQVKEQLTRFEIQRKEFLEKRRQLLERYKAAPEAERQKIRERFQELLKRWTELSKERPMESDIRQRALEAKFKAHEELLRQAREQARQQTIDQTRDRVRGRD